MKTPRILHYPGSKWSMTDWIIGNMPEHQTYLEPFFGSGAVFFNKPRSMFETINDMDGDVVNLFQVIRDRPDELARAIEWTPYAREEYYKAYETAKDELEKARRFLVRCWQAIGAKTSDRTGWKSNVDPNKCPNLPAYKQWPELPQKIIKVAKRLKFVQIENQPASQIISRYKNKDIMIYADPPYPLSTRNGRMYKHEMSDTDHMELLEVLNEHPGPVLLSGYDNDLYNEGLQGWTKEETTAYADSKRIRTEILWINPIAANQVGQQVLMF